MTTTELRVGQGPGKVNLPSVSREKTIAPVTIWAAFGCLCVLMAAYLWTRWLIDLPDPTPIGESRVPTAMMWNIIIQQFVGTVGNCFGIYWFIVRPWRRSGRLTFDGMLAIGAISMYWQEYFINLTQYVGTYNSGPLNWGSWYNFAPGWLPPDGEHFVESPFFGGQFWIYGILVVVLLFNFVMRRAKARWPQLGPWGMVGIAVAMGLVFDLVVESLWVASGIYIYPGLPGPKLFAGHYYQFPLVETLIWGPCWGLLACFRYFRNDKGESFVERGTETLRLKGKGKSALRLMAIVGFCNAVFLGYNIAATFAALHADAWPQDVVKRSYFKGRMCGPATERACPGPKVPVARRNSLTVTPDGRSGTKAGVNGVDESRGARCDAVGARRGGLLAVSALRSGSEARECE